MVVERAQPRQWRGAARACPSRCARQAHAHKQAVSVAANCFSKKPARMQLRGHEREQRRRWPTGSGRYNGGEPIGHATSRCACQAHAHTSAGSAAASRFRKKPARMRPRECSCCKTAAFYMPVGTQLRTPLCCKTAAFYSWWERSSAARETAAFHSVPTCKTAAFYSWWERSSAARETAAFHSVPT